MVTKTFARGNSYDAESALSEHAGELSLACSNGKCLPGFVPDEGNLAVGSLLVSVAVEFVFIEREVSVGTCIDANFNVIPFLFAAVLNFWAEGENASCGNIERKDVLRCGAEERFATVVRFACPEIVPGSA